MTLYYAWHLVTVALAFMALVLAAAVIRPEFVPLAWAMGWLTALFAATAIIITLVRRLRWTVLPQWIFFAPVAALTLWGTMA